MSFHLKKPSAIFKHLSSLGERNESEQNTLKPKVSENDRNVAGTELVVEFWLFLFFF